MQIKLVLFFIILILVYCLYYNKFIGGKKREKMILNENLGDVKYSFEIDNYFELNKNDILITTCLFLNMNHSKKKHNKYLDGLKKLYKWANKNKYILRIYYDESVIDIIKKQYMKDDIQLYKYNFPDFYNKKLKLHKETFGTLIRFMPFFDVDKHNHNKVFCCDIDFKDHLENLSNNILKFANLDNIKENYKIIGRYGIGYCYKYLTRLNHINDIVLPLTACSLYLEDIKFPINLLSNFLNKYLKDDSQKFKNFEYGVDEHFLNLDLYDYIKKQKLIVYNTTNRFDKYYIPGSSKNIRDIVIKYININKPEITFNIVTFDLILNNLINYIKKQKIEYNKNEVSCILKTLLYGSKYSFIVYKNSYLNNIENYNIFYTIDKKKHSEFYNLNMSGGFNNLHLSTDLFLRTCKELELPFELIDNKTIIMYNKDKTKNLKYHRLYNQSINKKKKQKINKISVSKIFKKNNLPTTQNIIFDKPKNIDDIKNIIKNNNISYPLVIKPIDSTGGIKVFVNLKSDDDVFQILKNEFLNKHINRSKSQKIMFEDFIDGLDHRILAYEDKIFDVIKRTPAYVIGDGKSTLKELIDKANIIKQKNNHYLIPIKKHFLKQNNLKLNSIIPNNKLTYVNNVTNFHQGGFLERIELDKVHPDNINMLKKINKHLDLKLSGIDLIIPDITKSYKSQKCTLNEVNTSPNFDIHYILDKSTRLIKKYLELYFKAK